MGLWGQRQCHGRQKWLPGDRDRALGMTSDVPKVVEWEWSWGH